MVLWLWGQALRSTPALVGWRIRRLALAPRAALVVAGRGGRRGLTLPVAVSVSAHALVLAGALSLVLSRVEEIQPPFAIDTTIFTGPSADEAGADGAVASAFAGDVGQVRSRRLRTARRPLTPHPPAPALAEAPASSLTASQASGELTAGAPPISGPASGPTAGGPSPASASGLPAAGPTTATLPRSLPGSEPRLRLPPRVGEKRCLSCPTPQLPHPYARLGIGQEVVVRTCVGIKGDVTSAEVLHGFDPVVDAEVIATVRRWQLAPYSLDGHPVPFCYATRFLFTTH
jgi:hypothetical protein